MANQGPNNTYNAAQVPGQAQMRRDDMWNHPFDSHNQSQGQGQGQGSNFLQETGEQVKNMAQGAADIGMGAAQGAVNIARGAAMGAANMTQGAADAVKNTMGMNNSSNTMTNSGGNNWNAMNPPTGMDDSTWNGMNPPTHTSDTMNMPGNTADMGGSTHPININYPSNPNTRI